MVCALKGCGDPCGRAVNIWVSKPSGLLVCGAGEDQKSPSSSTMGNSWTSLQSLLVVSLSCPVCAVSSQSWLTHPQGELSQASLSLSIEPETFLA